MQPNQPPHAPDTSTFPSSRNTPKGFGSGHSQLQQHPTTGVDPRSGGTGGIQRGFGRSSAPSSGAVGLIHGHHHTVHQDKDYIVQQTDLDASGSRLAAVNLGYLHDPYAALLHPAGETDRPKRFPLINRGTYTRAKAIDELVLRFLKSIPRGGRKQIVSLGAGSDTRYWRLKGLDARGDGQAGEVDANSNANIDWNEDGVRGWLEGLVYHELDFPEVSRKKAEKITRWGVLSRALGSNSSSNREEAGEEGRITPTPQLLSGQQHSSSLNDSVNIDLTSGTITSPDYYLHPIDIRSLKLGSPTSPLPASIDTTLPTLIISECCLIYLTPVDADAILTFFATTFKCSHPLSIVLYEPIGSDDAFGKVMIQNLATRGIVLQTLKKYSTLMRQKERLRLLGFKGGQAVGDVDWIWENWVSANEKERLAKLEMLDEVEEWKLLARHYCVVWGWKNGEEESAGWDGWSNVASQTLED